jgi:hypothetical protein
VAGDRAGEVRTQVGEWFADGEAKYSTRTSFGMLPIFACLPTGKSAGTAIV